MKVFILVQEWLEYEVEDEDELGEVLDELSRLGKTIVEIEHD